MGTDRALLLLFACPGRPAGCLGGHEQIAGGLSFMTDISPAAAAAAYWLLPCSLPGKHCLITAFSPNDAHTLQSTACGVDWGTSAVDAPGET